MSPEAQLPAAPPPDALPPKADVGMTFQKVAPAVAVYKTSDMGPFICSNCHYFEDDGSCTLVDGPIDPEGVCNMFTAIEGEPGETPTQPEEAPVEPGAEPLPPK